MKKDWFFALLKPEVESAFCKICFMEYSQNLLWDGIIRISGQIGKTESKQNKHFVSSHFCGMPGLFLLCVRLYNMLSDPGSCAGEGLVSWEVQSCWIG